jgi:hypothetical protein
MKMRLNKGVFRDPLDDRTVAESHEAQNPAVRMTGKQEKSDRNTPHPEEAKKMTAKKM